MDPAGGLSAGFIEKSPDILLALEPLAEAQR